MKSLYESILQSTGSGRTEYVRHLIQNPQEDKVNTLNKAWKELGLSFDAGHGEGEWVWDPVNKRFSYIARVKTYETAYDNKKRIQDEVIAQCQYEEKHIVPGIHSIIVHKDYETKKVTIRAKKIAEVLKMKIVNRVYIFLDI